MFNPEILSHNIKKGRIKLGLTQNELAEMLYVSAQSISKWELGQSVPDLINLTMLSDIFSTSVDKIIGHKLSTGERVFVGIDGGTTKTEFVLFNESGTVLNRLVLEGCNPKISGVEKTLSVLKNGIDRMLAVRPDIYGGFAGITGVRSGNNLSKIKKYTETTYPLLKLDVKWDVYSQISSVTDYKEWITAICGTGFAAFISKGDEIQRMCAWGYVLDNMCGGYGIGREVIRAVMAEHDGFGQKTLLTSLTSHKLSPDYLENLDKIYLGGDGFIASFAPYAFDACEKGDDVAKGILDESMCQISNVLKHAIREYSCDNNIVLTGGLAKNSNFEALLREKMDDNINFVIPELPPVYGSCVRACKMYGNMKQDFYENFKQSYNEYK